MKRTLALLTLILAATAGAQIRTGVYVNNWPSWVQQPTAAMDGYYLSYSDALKEAVWAAVSVGGTLSGLTATRVPFAASATSVEDDAGLTYIKASDTLNLQGPLVLGIDAAGGVANTAGQFKLFSAGDNAFYTTITSGTNTANIAYTLPVDDGTASLFLQTDGSGVLTWATATTATPDLAAVTAAGGSTSTALTLSGGVSLSTTPSASNVVNGTFAADSDWTKGTGWAIGSGVATKTAGSASTLAQTVSTITAGTWYLLTYDVPTLTASTIIPSGGGWTGSTISAAGTGFVETFYATTTGALTFTSTATTAGTLDNVLLQPLAGRTTVEYSPLTAVNTPLTVTRTLSSAQTNQTALHLGYTTNKAGGNDTGLLIDWYDQASPGTSNGIDFRNNGTSKFSVNSAGTVTGYSWSGSGTVTTTSVGKYGGGSGFGIALNAATSATNPLVTLGTSSTAWTHSSGTGNELLITYALNETGTAGFTGLRVSATNTAKGSGTHYLLDGYVGGVERWHVGDDGSMIVKSASGGSWEMGQTEETITLATDAAYTDSTANMLPANAIIYGVGCVVVTEITTAANWSAGDATTAARFFAAQTTLTQGFQVLGLAHHQGGISTDATGPVQTAAAKLRITLNTTPGAGVVKCVTNWGRFAAPSL